MSTTAEISFLGVVISAGPLLVVVAIVAHLQLGLNKDLAIGALRCAGQLSAVGFILAPIFTSNRWYITLPYTMTMCGIAAIEAVSRPKFSYPGMLLHVLLALSVICSLMLVFGLIAVIPIEPIFDSRYFIPMLGMLAGNTCSSVALGLSTVLEDLTAGANKIEALLALGASRSEATQHVIRKGVKTALIPLINQLNVVGIVSLPGMMTGQVLGGTPPIMAARYQIVIFFLITAAVTLSTTVTIYCCVFTIVGNHHSLQATRIQSKSPTRDALIAAYTLATQWIEQYRGRNTSGYARTAQDASGRLASTSESDDATMLTKSQNRDIGEQSRLESATLAETSQPTTFRVSSLIRYVGANLLHDNVNLSLRSNEILFVVGPSGCGKTQLLRSLAALEEIDSGEISLKEQSPAQTGWAAWRAAVGYAFQQAPNFSDIAGAETPAKLFATASQFAAQRTRSHRDFIADAAALGLDRALLDREWKDLSGGQAQRAQLAVICALGPDVLLLDEPTSALDPEATSKTEHLLKTCGAAIIWITHDDRQPDRVGGHILKLG